MFEIIVVALITASILLIGISYVHFRNYVPILMYHRIADVPTDRNCVSPEQFALQMSYLHTHGYTTISPQQLYEYFIHSRSLPPKPVLLTFDDGYRDNFTEALPILKKYQMKATVFPISDWVGTDNTWENFGKELTKTMTWRELALWQEAGMSIYPHTANHPFLPNCNSSYMYQEMASCRDKLMDKLHSDMDYFCYPYGCFNEEVIRCARKIGYKMGFAIFENVPVWKLDLMKLPRLQISGRQSLREFTWKVSSFHIIFIYLRQWERRIKRKFR